ncbi:MAG: hypothetical protein CMH30_03050 [Micavibrio sp.]|nr:hypothetical protein [Micavibrio sp.]
MSTIVTADTENLIFVRTKDEKGQNLVNVYVNNTQTPPVFTSRPANPAKNIFSLLGAIKSKTGTTGHTVSSKLEGAEETYIYKIPASKTFEVLDYVLKTAQFIDGRDRKPTDKQLDNFLSAITREDVYQHNISVGDEKLEISTPFQYSKKQLNKILSVVAEELNVQKTNTESKEREVIEYPENTSYIRISGNTITLKKKDSSTDEDLADAFTFLKDFLKADNTKTTEDDLKRTIRARLLSKRAEQEPEPTADPVTTISQKITDFGNQTAVVKSFLKLISADETILTAFADHEDIGLETSLLKDERGDTIGIKITTPIYENAELNAESTATIDLIKGAIEQLAVLHKVNKDTITKKRLIDCINAQIAKSIKGNDAKSSATVEELSTLVDTFRRNTENYQITISASNGSIENFVHHVASTRNIRTSFRPIQDILGVTLDFKADTTPAQIIATIPSLDNGSKNERTELIVQNVIASIVDLWATSREANTSKDNRVTYLGSAINAENVRDIVNQIAKKAENKISDLTPHFTGIVRPSRYQEVINDGQKRVDIEKSPLVAQDTHRQLPHSVKIPEFQEHRDKMYVVFRSDKFDVETFNPKAERSDEIAWELTENQAHFVREGISGKHVFVTGPAGTAKTALGVFIGLHNLKKGRTKKLIIGSSAAPLEETGFKPGDDKEKNAGAVSQIYAHLRDALELCNPNFGDELFAKLEKDELVEQMYFSDILGNNYKDSTIYLDECQKMNYGVAKSAFTRVGARSQLIATGSDTQNFANPGHASIYTMIVRQLQIGVKERKIPINRYGFIAMTNDDIKRSGLVADMEMHVFPAIEEQHADMLSGKKHGRSRNRPAFTPDGS